MPELPEVETICQGLRQCALGQLITNVTVRERRLRIPVASDFSTRIKNSIISNIRRRAKYILLDLNTGDTILIHLGMSGRLTHISAIRPLAKHDHIILHLSEGQDIRFNDARRFGMALLIRTNNISTHHLFTKLGPEPLESTFTVDYLYEQLQHRSSPIKNTLMNNSIVVGIGNIYANEALFRAGIHPVRPANTLNKKEVSNLHMAIVVVLKEALEAGGSTLKDYVQADGTTGYFAMNFKVYGRHNQPCTVCETPIEKIKV